MSDDFYHEQLMALSRAAGPGMRLERPHGSATRDNPLCGDRVTIDVNLSENRVSKFAQQTRGCILCRAAAATVMARVEGLTSVELRVVAEGIAAYLTAATAPRPMWPEMAAFLPVRGHPSRRPCVLLAFEALLDAVADAETKRQRQRQ